MCDVGVGQRASAVFMSFSQSDVLMMVMRRLSLAAVPSHLVPSPS